MNPYSLKNFQRPQLKMPNGSKRLLMHSCCAPCAGEIMEAVAASDIDTTIFNNKLVMGQLWMTLTRKRNHITTKTKTTKKK